MTTLMRIIFTDMYSHSTAYPVGFRTWDEVLAIVVEDPKDINGLFEHIPSKPCPTMAALIQFRQHGDEDLAAEN